MFYDISLLSNLLIFSCYSIIPYSSIGLQISLSVASNSLSPKPYYVSLSLNRPSDLHRQCGQPAPSLGLSALQGRLRAGPLGESGKEDASEAGVPVRPLEGLHGPSSGGESAASAGRPAIQRPFRLLLLPTEPGDQRLWCLHL